MPLTQEQIAFFRDMEQTFMTPGWTRLVKGWKDEAEALPQIAFFSGKDMADIETARVRFSLLQELINLPEVLQARHQELLEPTEGGYE